MSSPMKVGAQAERGAEASQLHRNKKVRNEPVTKTPATHRGDAGA
jgi:hypothetical protein